MTSNRRLLAWFLVAVLSVTGLLPATGISAQNMDHRHATAPELAYDDPSPMFEDCIQVVHCQASGWLDTAFSASGYLAPGLLHLLPMMDASVTADWIPDPVHPPPRLA